MRHRNPRSISRCSGHYDKHVTSPCQSQYIDAYCKNGFAKATSKKCYVKILQYINDHADCTRKDICIALFGWNENYRNAKSQPMRGEHSNTFAQLLYLDLIDYDKKFRYHITSKGQRVLRTAYLNDMAKFVLKK